MLKTRVITALVLLAVLLPVTLWAPINGFGVLIAFVMIFAAWEWARLLKLERIGTLVYAALCALALVASMHLLSTSETSFYKASVVFWVIAAPYALLRKPTLADRAWRGLLLMAGAIVLIACWYALVAARIAGIAFVLSLLLVVWFADIGAYFAGKAFGRHKLAPSISPGKTWEGAFGGWLLVMALAAAAMATGAWAPTLFSRWASQFGWLRALLAVTLLVVFSIVGDLFESLLKRQAGVKDSSGLLPGHGGVLDRIDALLPVLPLAMLLLG